MLFYTYKTFTHLLNVNQILFKDIREISVPSLTVHTTTIFKAQKDRKDIAKVLHVTPEI